MFLVGLGHAKLLHLPRDHIRQRAARALALDGLAFALEPLVHVRTTLVQLLQRLLAFGLGVVVPREAGLDRAGCKCQLCRLSQLPPLTPALSPLPAIQE